ncbi:MAG: helix-turn-helix transcriptional regulator [Lachnospira sp.]|nr:helix-turn-helix transcriptional regulator [Lachnospira sp.]
MEHIRILRKSQGLSQREMAQLFHTSQQSIYKYETGQAYPSLSTLREMSTYFNTTIDYLISDDSVEAQTGAIPQLRLTQDEFNLLQNYRLLAPQGKKMLRTISSKMTKNLDSEP